MVKIRDLEVEYRSVDGLASHARNPRTHSKKQIHRIAESIRAFDLNLEFDLTLTGFETSEGDDGNRYADFADGADGSRVRHVHELRGLAEGRRDALPDGIGMRAFDRRARHGRADFAPIFGRSIRS